MWIRILLLILLIPFFQNCSKPGATVFEDHRLAQEAEIKICLLGDLGMDTPHQKEIAKALDKEECHRIFFLGDLVYPDGIESINDPVLEKNFLSYYTPLLSHSPRLIINLLLGNHDHQGNASAWMDLAQQNQGYFFPYYYYMVDYGGLCMVALDTSFYFYKEKLPEAAEQTIWLTQLHSRLKDCEVKVALTHHPFKGGSHSGSKDWNDSEGSLRAFFETYIIGKFDLLISGHVHLIADDGRDAGTKLLLSGTGGEVRGDGRAGFIVLTWAQDNPKRIGYRLKYVDTVVNVINDDVTGHEEQEASEEEFINKMKLDAPSTFWDRIILWFSRFM
jgi:predicted phosphodiesterase